MTLEELTKLLLKAWGADTAKGSWDERCPELNQCAVTALVVQDVYGGDLLRCKTKNDDSHYWNRLPDGTEVDLTFGQFAFSGDVAYKSEYIVRDREYVLSYPDTVRRYELLKSRL